MTSKQVLEQWVQQHRSINTLEEKQVFYQQITAKLDAQTGEQRLTGLLALKDWVSEQRLEIERNLLEKTSPGILVFPPSDEDRAFLQALFFRMNIPYEMTA